MPSSYYGGGMCLFGNLAKIILLKCVAKIKDYVQSVVYTVLYVSMSVTNCQIVSGGDGVQERKITSKTADLLSYLRGCF